jgi:hypothetical protein
MDAFQLRWTVTILVSVLRMLAELVGVMHRATLPQLRGNTSPGGSAWRFAIDHPPLGLLLLLVRVTERGGSIDGKGARPSRLIRHPHLRHQLTRTPPRVLKDYVYVDYAREHCPNTEC